MIYDLPETEGLTPDEAKTALDKMDVEIAQDRGHPYLSGDGLLHRRFVEARQALHQCYAERPGGELGPFERAMQEGLESLAGKEAERQVKLRAEAEQEMENLIDLGFEEAELPEDVQPYQVNALRMQRLAAQEDYKALTPMLEKDLRDLQTPPDLMATFESFAHVENLDPGLRARIVEELIRYIHAANTQKHGRKPE